jgi:pimeloyl-ACP methyl ester carboxylesterase
LICIAASVAPLATARADTAIASKDVKAGGIAMHYLSAGTGPDTVILIHGYAQSSHMWRAKAIPELARRFTVIAPDLPGFGDSDIPGDGLDIKSAAIRIHDLATTLHITHARVVGHDIGLMVAYVYAAMYPHEVDKLVLMNAFLPGIGDWQAYYYGSGRWHFFFNGPTPEALVNGRERIYFEHFWNDFSLDPKHSLSEDDRRLYSSQYSRPGRMRAGWAYFAAFPQAARDIGELARTPLAMPVLVIADGKPGSEFLIQQAKVVAPRLTTVTLADSGHWAIDEQPSETMAALVRFL